MGELTVRRVTGRVLEGAILAEARVVTAGVLRVLRSIRRGEGPSEVVVSKLKPLGLFWWKWHHLAWAMGGFERGSLLAVTLDSRVLVALPSGEQLHGDPEAGVVTEITGSPTVH
jgi:hypothetical protein